MRRLRFGGSQVVCEQSAGSIERSGLASPREIGLGEGYPRGVEMLPLLFCPCAGDIEHRNQGESGLFGRGELDPGHAVVRRPDRVQELAATAKVEDPAWRVRGRNGEQAALELKLE